MSSSIDWGVVGPIATLVGALLGIGVGWGSMKLMVASLKVEVGEFKAMATEMKTKVTTLEVNEQNNTKTIETLVERVNAQDQRVNGLERDVAVLKAKQPRSRARS